MERRERSNVRDGYELLELSIDEAAEPSRPDDQLQDLQRELDSVCAELEQAHRHLDEIGREAQAAVEAEDAARATATWEEKHRLLNRVSELQQAQLAIHQQLNAQLQGVLANLRQQRAEIDQRQGQHDAAWRQVIASAEALVDAVRIADQHREELLDREREWRMRLESVAGWPAISSRFTMAPRQRSRIATRVAGNVTEQHAGQKWSVYDPDSGMLVGTLPELARLLTRWYPNLRTEEERVREFLTTPNANPMPDDLRRELQAAGYINGKTSSEH